uniref:J domain-containing protein n=3 Tax=Auxenochlorella protothecoides TaxID=3075 RepID=A0A1D1ZPP6_AUXPR
MGAHVWVRDTSKSTGGKTYVAGTAKSPAPPPPKRAKLTWNRDAGNTSDAAEPDGLYVEKKTEAGHPAAGPQQPPRPSSAAPQPAPAHGPNRSRARPRPPQPTAPQAPQKSAADVLREMEKLKAAVAAAEQSRRQAQDTTRACQDRDAALLAQRRRRLESGFAKVYEEARKQADADLAAQRASAPSLTFADEAEVRRVLQAASDHAVLQLPPGANAAVLRKRYRQMAVSLHPDKSSAPGAADAFHRLVTAYRNLAAFA